VTALRHQWEPASHGADVCFHCGVKRITWKTKGPDGQAQYEARYLVSGVGWTTARPDCFDRGIRQGLLFAEQDDVESPDA
jgi:hypothetical protein